MAVEKSIFEVRRHSLLGAIMISVTLSLVYFVHLNYATHSAFETIMTHSSLGNGLYDWQIAHPLWASVMVGCGVAYLGIKMGQLASRFNLYGVPSHLPMEIYPLVLGGVMVNIASLRMTLVAGLIAYSMFRLFHAYRSANSSGWLLSGTMALGGAALLYPPAIILWAVMPFVIVFFDRTTREVIVSIFGLLLVPMTYIYIKWLMGGSFTGEVALFVERITTPNGYSLFDSFRGAAIGSIALVLYMSLNAIFAISLLENTVKAKRRLTVVAIYAVLIALMVLIPSSDSSTFGLLAIPTSVLIPVTMLKFSRLLSFILYVVLIVAAVAVMCGL